MKNQRKASSNVQLSDEMSHVHELPKEHLGEHFQDHIAVAFFGKAGDNDIFTCGTIYHVGGKLWGIADGAVQQTNLIIAPSDQRIMKNNDFVGNRMDPIKSYGNFRVVQEADRVIWKAGNREIVCRPPYWELKGECLGVYTDLTMGGTGKTTPFLGSWADLGTKGAAGDEQLGRAEGIVTFRDRKYSLDEGWAIRERICLGKGWDVFSLRGSTNTYPTTLWGWCFSESITIFCYAYPELNLFAGRAYLADQVIEFDKDQITIEPLESWKDPLTNMTFPTRWNIKMKSAGGAVEMEVNTWARALFGFHLSVGYTTHHGALGRTNGRFVFPDGHSIPIADSLSYMEQGNATPLGTG